MPIRSPPIPPNPPDSAGVKRAAKPWGVGRVAFFARIDEIMTEPPQGWPLTAIYARHKSALGISYGGFWRLVVRHAADSRPTRQQAAVAASAPPRAASGVTTGAGEHTPAEGGPPRR